MAFTALEPSLDGTGGVSWINAAIYPYIYTAKIIVTTLVISLCFRYWLREFPFRFSKISYLAVVAGVVGVVLWVGVCKLGLESRIFSLAGLESAPISSGDETSQDAPKIVGSGLTDEERAEINSFQKSSRSGFNPFQAFQNPAQAWTFFILRMIGLALVVPLLEEFFLRGFLLRFIHSPDWTKVPMGAASPAVWITVLIYAVATHPGEAIAAMLWFSLITLLVYRTKNIWDAVFAHGITNFLLGIYVFHSGDWHFL